MKLIETLTSDDMSHILSASVGLFQQIITDDDEYYDYASSFCMEYYLSRSGNKTITPIFSKIIELSPNLDEANYTFGKMIRNKFVDKWHRIYSTLKSQYDVLSDYEYTEEKNGENSDTDTHNTTKTRESTSHDANESTSLITRNTDISTEDDVYGFNSITAVHDSKSAEDTRDESNSSSTDTNDSTDESTESYTGTDKTDYIIHETVNKTGRDKAGSTLINKEIEMRTARIFYDILLADVDSLAVLQIYI